MTGRADIRERLAVALLAVAPGLTVDKVLTYWFQHDARLNRELLIDLAALRDAGLRVYLATNQEHARARYLMDTLGLSAHLDGLLLCGDWPAQAGIRVLRDSGLQSRSASL